MSKRLQVPRHLDHSAFGPLYNETSRTLILGSFPSVKSREAAFYYGHPQNRFWRIIRALYDPEVYDAVMRGEAADVPKTKDEKTALILDHGLALWDTIYSCDIIGSQDAAIRNAEPCDIPWLLKRTCVDRIFCNGTVSYDLFMKYCLPEVEAYCRESPQSGVITDAADHGMAVPSVTKLPSTSPANAAWSLPKLIEAWKVILS